MHGAIAFNSCFFVTFFINPMLATSAGRPANSRCQMTSGAGGANTFRY